MGVFVFSFDHTSNMSGFLRGGIAVITGAGSGIGKGVAAMMAEQGARVAVCDLSLESAQNTVREIIDRKGQAIAVEMDVTSEEQVSEGFNKICQDYSSQRVDVLVANAGYQHISALEDFSLADWNRMMNVHLNGSFLTSREAVKRMKLEENGRK